MDEPMVTHLVEDMTDMELYEVTSMHLNPCDRQLISLHEDHADWCACDAADFDGTWSNAAHVASDHSLMRTLWLVGEVEHDPTIRF